MNRPTQASYRGLGKRTDKHGSYSSSAYEKTGDRMRSLKEPFIAPLFKNLPREVLTDPRHAERLGTGSEIPQSNDNDKRVFNLDIPGVPQG